MGGPRQNLIGAAHTGGQTHVWGGCPPPGAGGFGARRAGGFSKFTTVIISRFNTAKSSKFTTVTSVGDSGECGGLCGLWGTVGLWGYLEALMAQGQELLRVVALIPGAQIHHLPTKILWMGNELQHFQLQ